MISKTSLIFPIQPIIDQFEKIPYFDSRLTLNETDGNLLTGKYKVKDEYIGTPLGNLLKEIGKIKDIGEARLLKLKGEEVYTAHCDPDDRYDLVITTNPFCYLIDIENNIMHHLRPTGEIWKLDTSVRHTAANFGTTERVYLNIRERLPLFSFPGYNIKFSGIEFNWKQVLYEDIMKYLNIKIKSGEVWGIEKVNDLELMLNATNSVIDFIKTNAESKGFAVRIDHS